MWLIVRMGGVSMSFAQTMNAGFTPFIVGGIIKAIAGAAVIGGLWKAVGRVGLDR